MFFLGPQHFQRRIPLGIQFFLLGPAGRFDFIQPFLFPGFLFAVNLIQPILQLGFPDAVDLRCDLVIPLFHDLGFAGCSPLRCTDFIQSFSPIGLFFLIDIGQLILQVGPVDGIDLIYDVSLEVLVDSRLLICLEGIHQTRVSPLFPKCLRLFGGSMQRIIQIIMGKLEDAVRQVGIGLGCFLRCLGQFSCRPGIFLLGFLIAAQSNFRILGRLFLLLEGFIFLLPFGKPITTGRSFIGAKSSSDTTNYQSCGCASTWFNRCADCRPGTSANQCSIHDRFHATMFGQRSDITQRLLH